MTEISEIEKKCLQNNLRLTEPRKIIAKILSNANDHPDVDEIYLRVNKVDKRVSLATIYRTLKLFSEVGIIERRDFLDGRSRYEPKGDDHDHLIEINTGDVIEFSDEDIVKKLREKATEHGYNMVDYKLEIYVVKKEN